LLPHGIVDQVLAQVQSYEEGGMRDAMVNSQVMASRTSPAVTVCYSRRLSFVCPSVSSHTVSDERVTKCHKMIICTIFGITAVDLTFTFDRALPLFRLLGTVLPKPWLLPWLLPMINTGIIGFDGTPIAYRLETSSLMLWLRGRWQ
jgi:hypothetical protein